MGNPSFQSNGPLSQELYSQGSGASSSDPFINVFSQRDPTATDANYPVKKRWLNFGPLGPKEWILENFTNIMSPTNIAGQTQANWVLIASGTSTNLSLEGNTGGPVFPTANNINVVGDGTTITVAGNPITSTLTISLIPGGSAVESLTGDDGVAVTPLAGTITLKGVTFTPNGINAKAVFVKANGLHEDDIQVQVSAAIASTNIANVGLAAFSNAQFTVDTNGFVQLIGGTTPPVLGITPDAFTAPGTSPVVPNASGNIKIEGGATFATGTQAHPIRTNSLAANTLDLQIQLAGSNPAVSTPNDFGVAQFDANQFTVTAGFVQISNFSPFHYTAITHNGTNPSPYTVTATDEYISVDTTATTPGTVTILLPNAPTQFREFVIKDRTGAASTNNISVTTVGGAVTIDGQTTYTMAGNFDSIQLLFNGTSYEVF